MNVQDEITYAFTKQDVTLTHPSGVKVVHPKADVQERMDRIDSEIATLQAEKANIKTNMLDKITNAVSSVKRSNAD